MDDPEVEPEDKKTWQSSQVFYTVCAKCNHHDSQARIEFNFREQVIYSMCAACKTMNKMAMPSLLAKPYPKSRTGRG
jgi:Zn ribbon nucleic-acid-binding protein